MNSGAGPGDEGYVRFGWDHSSGPPPVGKRIAMRAGGHRALPGAELLVGEVIESSPLEIVARWDDGRVGTIDADHFGVMTDAVRAEPSEVHYAGAWTSEGPQVLRTPVGGEPRPLMHWVRHAPSGFGWGYAGSGAADLARSLLIDALPARLVFCALCGGRGLLRRDTACPECDEGVLIRPATYQDFKFAVVLGLAETWSLTRSGIREWANA